MKKYTTIPEFLENQPSEKCEQIELLRKIILEAVPVSEHIKWNAPSYVYKDEDRITFSAYGDTVKILIHMGPTRKENKKGEPIIEDPSGIISWASDIRGIITFADMNDVITKEKDLTDILQRWLEK